MIICRYARKHNQEKDWRCILSKKKCNYEYPIEEICKNEKGKEKK